MTWLLYLLVTWMIFGVLGVVETVICAVGFRIMVKEIFGNTISLPTIDPKRLIILSPFMILSGLIYFARCLKPTIDSIVLTLKIKRDPKFKSQCVDIVLNILDQYSVK